VSAGQPEGTFDRWTRLRATHSFGLVLLLIICSFTVGMALPDGDWAKFVLTAVASATLIVALWTAGTDVRIVAVVATASGLLVLLAALSALEGGDVGRVTVAAAWGILIAATPIAIIRSLRETTEVTIRAVTGALCIYLLIGMFFAAAYAVVAVVQEQPFFASGERPDTSNLLYFSYVTQTTLGYGDFTAASNLGRALAVVEALLGQVYLVTVVALAVANLGRKRLSG
jgi:hypothetical protein